MQGSKWVVTRSMHKIPKRENTFQQRHLLQNLPKNILIYDAACVGHLQRDDDGVIVGVAGGLALGVVHGGGPSHNHREVFAAYG